MRHWDLQWLKIKNILRTSPTMNLRQEKSIFNFMIKYSVIDFLYEIGQLLHQQNLIKRHCLKLC